VEAEQHCSDLVNLLWAPGARFVATVLIPLRYVEMEGVVSSAAISVIRRAAPQSTSELRAADHHAKCA